MHRHVALKDLKIQLAAIEGGAAGEGPLKRELAVVFLNVAGPDLFAVEVERHQLAVAVKEPDQIAIGDRRRRSKVAHVVHLDADSGLALPECFAFGAIEANGLERARLLVHGTDEDTV